MMNKIFYSFICLVIFSCVASPRYSSNPNTKSSLNKKSKAVTNTSKSSSNSNRRYSSNSNSKIRNDVITGISSWYGPNFHGKLTANGEVFDQYGVTAAHKTLPLGTVVRVTNLDNDKSVMEIAFDILEIIRKNKKIIVKGKGEMCSKAVAVSNILTERMLKETAKFEKIDVDSEMSDDGQLISTIKLAIVMTD